MKRQNVPPTEYEKTEYEKQGSHLILHQIQSTVFDFWICRANICLTYGQIRPQRTKAADQQTKIQVPTVNLADGFRRWTKIIIF